MHVEEEFALAVPVEAHFDGEDEVPVPVVGVEAIVFSPVGHAVLGLDGGPCEVWAVFNDHWFLLLGCIGESALPKLEQWLWKFAFSSYYS